MRLPKSFDVWIVDDEPALLKLVQCILEQQELRVVCCRTTGEFWEKAQFETPGCVIADLKIGNEDGLALIETFWRDFWPAPSILISGCLTTELTVRAVKAGLVTVLEKPLKHDNLRTEVAIALQRARETVEQLRQKMETQQRFSSLSSSHIAVLRELAVCTPHKRIATKLDMALRTVEKKRKEIYGQLEVETIADLLSLIHFADGPLAAYPSPFKPSMEQPICS